MDDEAQNGQEKMFLLRPAELVVTHDLDTGTAKQIGAAVWRLQQVVSEPDPEKALILSALCRDQLGPLDCKELSPNFQTGSQLEAKLALEMDHYMQAFHVTSATPIQVQLASIHSAFETFLQLTGKYGFDEEQGRQLQTGLQTYAALLGRAFDITDSIVADEEQSTSFISEPVAEKDEDPLWVWKRGHWVFFVVIQGLIVCMHRLKHCVADGDGAGTRIELEAATDLMWAAGAAMNLAANFSKQAYNTVVRPTMVLDHADALVKVSSLSGLMSWDHDYLVEVLWKKELAPIFKDLPAELQEVQQRFGMAYREGLAAGHNAICEEFEGRNTASVYRPQSNALEFLKGLERKRLRHIDPHKKTGSRSDADPTHSA